MPDLRFLSSRHDGSRAQRAGVVPPGPEAIASSSISGSCLGESRNRDVPFSASKRLLPLYVVCDRVKLAVLFQLIRITVISDDDGLGIIARPQRNPVLQFI